MKLYLAIIILSYFSSISSMDNFTPNYEDNPTGGETSFYNSHQQINGLNGEINSCNYCHLPSQEFTENAITLGWGNNSANRKFGTFSSNSSKDDKVIFTSQTKLCISCHDGSIANDNFIISNFDFDIINKNRNYTDGSNHPTSMKYDIWTAQKNKLLRDPSITPSGLGGTIEEDLLEDGMVTCLSCHNIHPMGSAVNYEDELTLKITMVGSELCLTCHNI